MSYDFDKIAHTYDRLNRMMTFGIDRCWRKRAVKEFSILNSQLSILDVACGTGDMAIALAQKGHRVTGIDLSEEMLAIARQKAAKANIGFIKGDAERLPFDEGSFNAVCCAFGIRNFVDLERGLAEMSRVLEPGGQLAVLELSIPTCGLPLAIYRLYTLHLIPLLGQIVASNREAYTYLPRSIMAFYKPTEVAKRIVQAGFGHCTVRRFTFGTCTLYTATKPKQ
ncbi:MAG: bifunctional demethylmenaquinone methyltransferase/2-methoxy-6-polyprenyl-1,4-benzoquinol methylase UbiE [Bacteroidales bacterium]|nr:bifunctional demethylmenaquinone methyltransferase/2-methoxy-6-polyprenyl-1,4-benzoquinol methylase UbiE [Bacteroidales bacterium]